MARAGQSRGRVALHCGHSTAAACGRSTGDAQGKQYESTSSIGEGVLRKAFQSIFFNSDSTFTYLHWGCFYDFV